MYLSQAIKAPKTHPFLRSVANDDNNVKPNNDIRMLEVIRCYKNMKLSIDDYLQLRDDLRENGVNFTNLTLKDDMQKLGYIIP